MGRDGRPWIAIDTTILRNPKIEGCSSKAVVLCFAFLCHCGDELTDGHVRKGALGRLLGEARATRRHLGELVRVGLVVRCDDGYFIPGYLDWNPSRSWWVRKRAADARRQRAWRAGALGGGS